MTKHACRYCKAEASPKNLLRIETLPLEENIITVCNYCFVGEYQIEHAGQEVVKTAEVMLAAAVGDERAVEVKISRDRLGYAATLFLL
jgi:hypothetical protein